MKVTIENYRGFDIEFDTEYEKFSCIVSEENTKESKSFSSVKKFINDYKKNNQDFKPFYVEKNPKSYNYKENNKLKIIGIRKDGRFVAENENGEKLQISDYDTSGYILVNAANKEIMSRINILEKNYDEYQNNYRQSKKQLIEKLKIVTLNDYRKELINL